MQCIRIVLVTQEVQTALPLAASIANAAEAMRMLIIHDPIHPRI